jgi:hypothetical protein
MGGSTTVSYRIHSPPETCCDGSRGSIQIADLQTQDVTTVRAKVFCMYIENSNVCILDI